MSRPFFPHIDLHELEEDVAAGTCIAGMTFPAEAMKKIWQGTKQPPLRTIVRTHGPRGTLSYCAQQIGQHGSKSRVFLAHGVCVFVLNVAPTTTLQLTAETHIRQRTTFLDEQSGYWKRIPAGIACGMAGAGTATIMENLVTQQQMPNGAHRAHGVATRSLMSTMGDMYRSGGMRRFWRSMPLIATRDSIFTSFMFVVNPDVKRRAAQHSWFVQYLASFALCAVGATVSHPFDTVATVMQMSPEKKSARAALSELVKEGGGGPMKLWKGLPFRVFLFFSFANGIPWLKACAHDFTTPGIPRAGIPAK